MYPSGQVKLLTSFKNGELDGRVTVWNENRYETRKANYKNGMKVK
jgi:antitoxin component YwqK of YwqJK toxin-antitoxin module